MIAENLSLKLRLSSRGVKKAASKNVHSAGLKENEIMLVVLSD